MPVDARRLRHGGRHSSYTPVYRRSTRAPRSSAGGAGLDVVLLGSNERFEYRIVRSLASIYGIDISAGSIDQSRARMRSLIASHPECHKAGRNASRGFANAVEAILETNIVHADTVADTAKIDLVEYRPVNRGMFIREWSRLDPAANEPNLFSSSLRSDEAPIHYSMLRATPEPLGLREAA